jgi:hypothetical protein
MTIEQVLAANEKAMNFEPKTVNYSINLGFPSPVPAGFFEFAIVGQQDEKREAIPKIMKVFESNAATIVSMTFSNDQSVDQFIMNVVCDLNSAKCPPDELLIRVNKSKFVKVAEMSPLDGRVFGKFSFPLTFFGEIRALAIDADRFVHLFDEITRIFGVKAKRALFENGRLEGREIIEALKEKLGERSKEKQLLFENAKALFQIAGWGKLFFYTEGAEIYKVTINDPPSDADGGAMLGNYFLQGLVAGILEPFLRSGVKLSMIREGYEEEKRDLIMYYMDRASIKEFASEEEKEDDDVSLSNKKVLINTEAKQEEEVDDAAVQVTKIIKSIHEMQEVKKNMENDNPVLISETSEPAEANPVQGEIIGSGIQIIQEVDKPPVVRRKKKTIPHDNGKGYSSTDTIKF